MIKYGNEIYERINIKDEEEYQKEKNYMIKQNKKRNILSNKKKKELIKDRIIKNKKYIFIFVFIFLILIITFFSFFVEKILKNDYKHSTNIINNIINQILSSNDSKNDEKKSNNITKEENINTKEKDKDNVEQKEKIKEKEKEEKEEQKEKIKEKEEKEEQKEEEEEEEIKPKNEDIYKKEYFDGFETSFRKARGYLESNMRGELLNKKPFIKSNHPKVSGVIPVYNSQDVITRSVRSIQNQNMLDIEIILVDDFSTDNTSIILEQLAKEDPRIKLIKNKKNMGILYTRSIGSLAAKGKYIFPLDNDDMFLDKDVFQTITDRADKGNFDIIEFRGVLTLLGDYNKDLFSRRRIGTTFSPYGDNLVLFQPRLGAFPIEKGNRYGDYKIISVYLWSKCIKTKVYKKALNSLGVERYSRYMLRDEDFLVNYVIFNVAKSYKFLGKYGIIHIQTPGSGSDQPNHVQMNKQNIYVLEAALDFSKNITENKIWVAYYTTFILERPKLEETLKDKYINKLFLTSLDRIFHSQGKYFRDKDKEEIKKRVIERKYIKYSF